MSKAEFIAEIADEQGNSGKKDALATYEKQRLVSQECRSFAVMERHFFEKHMASSQDETFCLQANNELERIQCDCTAQL